MSILAGFSVPVHISTDAWSFLYLIPLVVLISVVYKTTKLREITAKGLAKEAALLSGSIVVFMAAVAAALYGVVAVLLR